MKTYPYGFKNWMNRLFQEGNKLGYWKLTVINYANKLDFDAWLVYFLDGLNPKEALLTDLKEQ